MRTSYYLALNYLNLALGDKYIRDNEGGGQETIVGIGTSSYIYDLYNFSDRMHVDTPISRGTRQGFAFNVKQEKYWNAMEHMPSIGVSTVSTGSTHTGIGTDAPFIGYETIQKSQENVMKAMLLAILDGDSKRTTSVGIGTTHHKKDIFYNALRIHQCRDYSMKPWGGSDAFISTHTTLSGISSISRTSNVAEITTSAAHGLSTSFDDWGAIVNINTSSFNISTTTYPNGVPIVITGDNTFTYRNTGVNTSISSGITGNANITVGWGGTSNNLHIAYE